MRFPFKIFSLPSKINLPVTVFTEFQTIKLLTKHNMLRTVKAKKKIVK